MVRPGALLVLLSLYPLVACAQSAAGVYVFQENGHVHSQYLELMPDGRFYMLDEFGPDDRDTVANGRYCARLAGDTVFPVSDEDTGGIRYVRRGRSLAEARRWAEGQPGFQGSMLEKAYSAAMKSDLHNLVTAQEGYFADNYTYSDDPAALGFQASRGVTVTITDAGRTGWPAKASHPRARHVCGSAMGTATNPVDSTAT